MIPTQSIMEEVEGDDSDKGKMCIAEYFDIGGNCG